MSHCGTPQGFAAHRAANTPACKWCKSAQAKHEAGTVKVEPVKTPRELAKCGTPAGAALHRKNGEPSCAACRKARAIRQQKYDDRSREKRGLPPRKRITTDAPVELQPCGSLAAWQRHYRAKETICDPCAEAKLVADRARSAANRKGPPPREHGTPKGRNQHYRLGEPICGPCKNAYNADQRQRQRKKAKP